MNALILGYGRAGKRHGKYLTKLGLDWGWYDPNLAGSLQEPFLGEYDLAVIASPPHLHLAQIKQCLENGVKAILCEKPLCLLGGQLQEAKDLLANHSEAWRVGVSYNYRFHPGVMQAKRTRERWQDSFENFSLYSRSSRPDLPEWGLLLDHVSHGLNTLSWLADDIVIETARYNVSDEPKYWTITGQADGKPFSLTDEVWRRETVRESWIRGPFGLITTAEPADVDAMYANMWRVFLEKFKTGEPFPVGLAEAIHTQSLLEWVASVSAQEVIPFANIEEFPI